MNLCAGFMLLFLGSVTSVANLSDPAGCQVKSCQQTPEEMARDYIAEQVRALTIGRDCTSIARENTFPKIIFAHANGTTLVERVPLKKIMKKDSGFWVDSFCY